MTKRHQEAGLRLVEIDDHFLILADGERYIRWFSSTGARVVDVRAAADEYLAGKDDFV